MKTLANFFFGLLAIVSVISWFGIGAMLIAWSTIPELGWFIVWLPFALAAVVIAFRIADAITSERREREAAAAMGKPYEPSDALANELANQKSNHQTIAQ